MNRLGVYLKHSLCVFIILSANAVIAQDEQKKQSIAEIFEETLAKEGLEAAKARFHEMMADESGRYVLDPYELAIALPNRLSLEGKRSEAIELLKLLEPTFGDNPRYWLEIGKAYLMYGDKEKSVSAFKKVLESRPDRGDIAWMLKNIDELLRIARIQVESEGKYEPGQNTGIKGPYLGQKPPGRVPEVFAPGILCSANHEYSITFSPDGREIYFSRGGVGLMVCREEEEGWTAPEAVTFIGGGAYSDEANVSPDGKRIFFCSRPTIRQSREIYVAEREGEGWGEPTLLFPGMYASSTRDGTLYYTLDLPGQPGNSDIVLRRPTADGYSDPETCTWGVNSTTQDAHPFIAPDESYILLDSMRDGMVGLCACFREKDGSWGKAIYLKDLLGIPPAGQPAVSPDGKYLFFCLAGDMYWVDAEFLDELRPEQTLSANQNQLQERMQAIMEGFLNDHDEILGALARLDISGRGSIRAAEGFFDNSHKTPIKASHRFSVGSTTKMFTATLVLQMIEEGRVRLKDKIIDHLPDEWANVLGEIEHGDGITIGQALSHRSGIYDYIINTTFFYRLLDSKKWTPLELLRLVKEEGRPKFKPGKSFNYSNTNYLLLGALVEHVTGKSINNAYKENIFSKLKLKNTFLSEGHLGSGQAGIAHGYFKEGDKVYDFQDFDSGWAWAVGGIISNAEDLNIFIVSLAKGELFKNKDTFEEMNEFPEGNNWYAHGIMKKVHPEFGQCYFHSGYDGATSSVVCFFPERQAAVSVCINYDGKPSRLRAINLMDLIIEKIL